MGVDDPSPNQPGATGAVTTTTMYDPRKREPQYAHAQSACLWELVRAQTAKEETACFFLFF